MGVLRVFELGNCTIHADVIVTQPSPSDPIIATGTFVITTADGATPLKASAVGTGTPDPTNPALFLNSRYDLSFTGATGIVANACKNRCRKPLKSGAPPTIAHSCLNLGGPRA
jgi:hypothetical protein